MANVLNNFFVYAICIIISISIFCLIFKEMRTGIKEIKQELKENQYTGSEKFIYILSRVFFGKDDE